MNPSKPVVGATVMFSHGRRDRHRGGRDWTDASGRRSPCAGRSRPDGDRYAEKAATFTPHHGGGSGYDLTLIQAEVLDELVLGADRRLGYAEARRNVITQDVDLNSPGRAAVSDRGG
jgi:hypothetical protein